jgi:hypothetical protein
MGSTAFEVSMGLGCVFSLMPPHAAAFTEALRDLGPQLRRQGAHGRTH